jgi:hypothetical protein
MAGYYFNRGATGVHDDLHAKAIVVDSGGVKAALVACDLIGLPESVVERARGLVSERTGIPAPNVMISATHAHTGPVLQSRGLRYKLEGEMLDLAREFEATLPARIAEAVALANAALEPVQVRAGLGREPSLTFNRRYYMKDGKVAWNPGKMNPNIVRPAGPTDDGAPVVSFERPKGLPVATYVNYALHLDTVGGTDYSADYPYTLSKLLSEVRGPQAVTLFTIGCAGNLNHIDVSTREPQKGHGEAARIGTILAAEVLKTMRRLTPVESTSLHVKSVKLQLPLAPYTAQELDAAKITAARFGQKDAPGTTELANATRIVDVASRDGKPVEAEVQVIALGKDVAWVGLPGEIFTELGLAIKKASPFANTLVVTLANGYIGYVPDRKAYTEGAYEVVSARCAAGSGEMMVDAAVNLLGELHGIQ